MPKLEHWLQASRPKTLSLSLVPVLAGNALAYADGFLLDLTVLWATLLAALAIQIGTNLHNDAADFERGADTPERLGPPRAVAQGWIKPSTIKKGALIAFVFAFLLGIFLTSRGGWPIVVIGTSALLAGWGYTAGPKPIAYSALGELFAFLFFGVFAVAGSYLLQTGTLSVLVWLAGASLGCFPAAVLLVNNYRDMDGDRRVGKLTIATRLGRPALVPIYQILLLAPYALSIYGVFLAQGWGWLLLGSLPISVWLAKQFPFLRRGEELNRQLTQTALLQILYGSLFAYGRLLLP